jgi:hypothetical protein
MNKDPFAVFLSRIMHEKPGRRHIRCSYLISSSSSSSERFLRAAIRFTCCGSAAIIALALYIDSYSCRYRMSLHCVNQDRLKIPAYLDLSHESAVRRDTIPPVLYHVHRIFPRQLEVLHYEHDHERGRKADAAWRHLHVSERDN